MPNQSLTKQAVRQQVRQALSAMESMTVYTSSLAACKHLVHLEEFARAETVMIYLSLPDEVDTTSIALAAWQTDKTVVVPKVDWRHRRVMPIEITHLETGMTIGRHGIPEPSEGRPVPTEMIDLIVTPGVAFDVGGRRLGRGGGFYDRFLPQCSRAVRCGLAFSVQVVEQLDTEPHDQQMDMLVTDEGVRQFSRSSR